MEEVITVFSTRVTCDTSVDSMSSIVSTVSTARPMGIRSIARTAEITNTGEKWVELVNLPLLRGAHTAGGQREYFNTGQLTGHTERVTERSSGKRVPTPVMCIGVRIL